MGSLVGCTGTNGNNNNSSGGDGDAVASTVVKGPVKTVELTQFYAEGEPYTTVYEYDEKGNVTSESTEWEGDGEEYDCIEALSEKDANGRCTKEVYGVDGVPTEIITHVYNEQGKDIKTESFSADGSWHYTLTNTYDAAGNLLENRTRNTYGEYATTFEYDTEGHQVKSIFTNNDKVFSVTENAYNDKGQNIYRKETYPEMNRVNETYTTYNEEGEENGYRCYVTDSEGYRLNNSDSTFTDNKGFRHERQFNNYDGKPKTMEGVFNKEGFLTHYEYSEGNAANPSVIVDFNVEKDGVTLRDIVWKDLMLGQVQNTRTFSCKPVYDTFGNWVRRTLGVSYLFDATYTKFEDLENILSISKRKITYRGDDQGQNYGFEGKAGNAELLLTFSEDDDVFCGELALDGNNWRAVGKRDREGNLFFVALPEEGDIPWSISIPSGEGKRAATLFNCKDGAEMEITLNPVKKDLKTYAFSTTSDDLVGLYCYNFEGVHASGELDVSRCGEDWENIRFTIENIWLGAIPKIATDEHTEYLGDLTTFYIYKWSDETETSIEYTVRFFDGFAVIRIERGNPSDFFPLGTTIEGIYAKLPSVG